MRNRKTWLIVAIVAVMAVVALYNIMDMKVSSEIPGTSAPPVETNALSPSPGRVVMLDLGATECIPCKMMVPILEELQEEYDGKAGIIFIDVWKEPDQARKYGIRVIPTQIFFDAEGREAKRHEGFLGKEQIIDILTAMGVS